MLSQVVEQLPATFCRSRLGAPRGAFSATGVSLLRSPQSAGTAAVLIAP